LQSAKLASKKRLGPKKRAEKRRFAAARSE
jgi:hypothetical protein